MISRERWAKLEPLVDGALDLPDRELQDYLVTSCGDDEKLRSEAERLLQAGRGGAALLEQGAASLALPLLEAAERAAQPAEGERVGPYELLGRLGEGGMGVVYRAHDPRLNREVALKLLPPWLAVSEGAGRRLLEEARAASALDHPHIETVYDVGTSDDGRPYIAMAYYDGETLGERIRRGPLPVHEAIEIGCEIAAGLSAAHAAGIVHRDIKPGNLMVTRDGHVKIVDFGVAKVLDQTQSTVGGVGATPGTVAYMSPEQTRGSVVGPATDLWSLSVVLYEMLGGQRPFAADSEQALIYRIRHDEPTPLRELRPEVPESLAAIVERCLAKEPDERHPDAEALGADLLRVAEGAGPALTRGRDRARRRTLAAAGVAVFLAILALAVGNRLGGQRGPSEPPAAAVTEPALAVLPFEVVGPEADLWREGMVSLISANLDGVDGLRIIDPQVILARWDAASSSNDTTGGSATLRPIIRTTGASHVLEGSLIGTENSVRLTARITDLASGNDLGLYQAEGPADSILRLVDRASLDVLRVILAEVPGRSRQPGLARVTTSSLPALKAYLAGEREYRHLRWDAAVGHYNEAVELDSTFALPLHRLALAHGWLNHATLHREYSERAVALRDHLSERERLLLMGQLHLTQGRSTAIDTFRRLVRTYPDYAEGWYGLGEAIAHLGGGPWAQDEFVDAFRRTLDLDPMYAPAHLHLLFAAVASGDADAARELVSRQESIDPDDSNAVAFRLTEALAFGDSASRVRARSDLRTVPEESLGLTHWFLLAAPDQAASFAAVTEVLSERGQQKATLRVWRLAREGRFSEARRLKDRLLPGWTWLGASWHLQGHEDPEGRDVLGPVRARAAEGGPSSMWSSFLVGALGAHAADWDAADSVVSVLRTRMPEGMAPADSATAQVARALGLLLQAYVELRQGADAVPPELDDAVPDLIMVGPAQIGTYTHDLVRFAAGRMLQQRGDLAGARAQYEQLQGFRDIGPPEIEFYLAQVYEGLGEPDRAITLYDRFLSWTARADPEYASMRQEATEALGRLRAAEAAPP